MRRQELQRFADRHQPDALIGAQGAQAAVAGDEQIGAGGERYEGQVFRIRKMRVCG